jgi:hypothetical protein
VYERLLVELRNADRVHAEAAKLGVPASALARAIKTFMLAKGGDTAGERANAERALSVLMRTHALERADVAALAKPVAAAELLQQGAEVRCYGHGLKVSAWTGHLAHACKALFGTGMYVLGCDFVFYGETAGAMSCAQLFAELHPTVLQLTDAYMVGPYAQRRDAGDAANPLSARASYRHGLCEAFLRLARGVAEQRKEYIARVVTDTAFQRAAVADLVEKRRLQRLAAQQAVDDTLAEAAADALAAAATAAANTGGAGAGGAGGAGAGGGGAGGAGGAGAGGGGAGGAGGVAWGAGAATACSICWNPMELGTSFITNPCGHAFHVTCQSKAVAAHLTRCALCRKPLMLAVFHEGAGAGAGAGDDNDDDDDDDDDLEDADADAYGGGGDDAAASEDEVMVVDEYTAAEVAAEQRAAAEVANLTEDQLAAHAQEVHRQHGDALTLALVADREVAVVKALHNTIFTESDRRKDGALKASCFRKSKRVARDAAAYDAGEQDAKKLKMGNALEG